MKILAIDSSTDQCSAALWLDGTVRELIESQQRHGERLLALVEQLLAESSLALGGLDAIGFSRGPGSFTSLRIGAGIVQGLAFGADLPVAPISSLAALAQGVDVPNVLAAFDARMQQVYWGAYRRGADGLPVLVDTEVVVAPDQAPIPVQHHWVGAGSGWDVYGDALKERVKRELLDVRPLQRPQARFVAALAAQAVRQGSVVAAELAYPVYIRDDVAVKSAR